MVHFPDDEQKKKARKKKERVGKVVRPPKKPEIALRRILGELWRQFLRPSADRILDMHNRGASILEIASEIERTLRISSLRYSEAASSIARKWVEMVSDDTRLVMQKGLQQSLGIDMVFLYDDPAIKPVLEEHALMSANLITSIPNKYLGQVARAVADNFAGRPLKTGCLQNEILHLGAVSLRKAELLARDQTAKLTGKLNQARQENIGVEEYFWRSMRDERVAGNPNGKYPDADPDSTFHGDHWHRNGKRFRWDSPPPDGHPGQPGFCRCYAQPIIDPAKIIAFAERQSNRVLKV